MKIGLALSGGGVLGVAHIGVIEELEKNKIFLDQISGASAGAIIATVYASGGIENLNNFFTEMSQMEIFRIKKPFSVTSPAALYEKIFQIVKKYSKDLIEDMPIKLTIVATDISDGTPKIFDSGPAIEAVKASCAYPGVFPIQEVNGNFYVDGGLTRNLPSDPIRPKCDFLIGSNLYGINKISNEKIKTMNRIKILSRTLDIIQKELAELFIRECDFCFEINTNGLKWYSFNRINEIRESGREQAAEQVQGFIKKLNC